MAINDCRFVLALIRLSDVWPVTLLERVCPEFRQQISLLAAHLSSTSLATNKLHDIGNSPM
eukprot:scaffold409661_cov14-Prasinocladus_malaysianus.AAC.1